VWQRELGCFGAKLEYELLDSIYILDEMTSIFEPILCLSGVEEGMKCCEVIGTCEKIKNERFVGENGGRPRGCHVTGYVFVYILTVMAASWPVAVGCV